MGTAVNYRIALVDDHHLVRAGLSALIGSIEGFSVVAADENADRLEHWMLSSGVDVLLLDISLRGESGLAVLQRVRNDYPDLPVIMLSMHDGADYVIRALRDGADGYLLKGAAEAELELALRSVLAGNRYLSPRVSGGVVDAMLKGAGAAGAGEAPLTARQKEILSLIAAGRATKEIAYELNISVKTVETYRAQIMERLDIRDVPGLVKYAIRHGFTSID